MTFEVVAEARLEYEDDEMSEEAAKENLRAALVDGTIQPTLRIERDSE